MFPYSKAYEPLQNLWKVDVFLDRSLQIQILIEASTLYLL